MRISPKLAFSSLCVLVLAGALATSLPGGASAPRRTFADEGETAAISRVQDLSLAFKRVARELRPSVVHISSVKVVPSVSAFGSGSPFGPSLREFFFPEPGTDPFRRERSPERGQKQTGLGTGVVISADGHILTNNHVVAGADEVEVRLSDGRTRPATVIGTDPETDLAVIKIDVDGLVPASLGDSSRLEAGEWVIAVGSPFGLDQTITAGIVSATGRSNVGIVDFEDFIQTDAAINPGNSGGPLVNLEGEVVGINTAIFSRSGGYMGIGFAIPVNMAKSITDGILRDGRIARGFLGVGIQDLDPALARSFGLDDTNGAVVAQVVPDGPADRAGLREGDIIRSLDGESVRDMKDVRERVAAMEPGREVEVKIVRDGTSKTFSVELDERSSRTVEEGAVREAPELGLDLRSVTPEIARSLGLDEETRGVVVTGVEPLGLGDRAGLAPRDVILRVQGRSVASVAEFRREVAKHDLDEGIRIQVRRGASTTYRVLGGER